MAPRARATTVAVAAAVVLFGAMGTPAASAADVSATTLRVDTLTNPIGLSDVAPELSWRLSEGQQAAYQIRVASTPARLDEPDLWDSGKVISSATNNVAYAGSPLRSRQAVAWSVRVWDDGGQPGEWSSPATWEMGLLSNADWSAKWIENPDYEYTAANGTTNPLPIFGKEFELSGQVSKARLYVTGLGQYAAKLNGEPTTDAVLEPGQTTYYKEVDYRTYDVTSKLRQGANLLGIEVGSGAYQRVPTPGRYFFTSGFTQAAAPIYGEPKAIAQLELTFVDGTRQTIVTDGSWRTRLGGTTYSGSWAGEDHDSRRVAPNWTAARAISGPEWRDASVATLTGATTPTATTPLVADQRPPVKVAHEAEAVAITRVTPDPVNTTLGAAAGAGERSIRVASTQRIQPGDTLTIGDEARGVAAVGADGNHGTSITLATPLTGTYATGARSGALPARRTCWTSARTTSASRSSTSPGRRGRPSR